MSLDSDSAVEVAKKYFRMSTDPLRLGWGISGYVYLSPDGNTAVKIYRREEGYANEWKVYRTLRKLKINQINGLEIPTMRDFSREFEYPLIRMDVVSPPYLLDFAGVQFVPPETNLTPEQIRYWHWKIGEQFGPNAGVAYDVYNALSRLGIYYLDFRTSNLNLDGLPGLTIPEPSTDDEYEDFR